MAVSTGTAIALALGAGASAYGASQTADAQRDAANAAVGMAQFNPYAISTGNQDVQPLGSQINASQDPNIAAIGNLLSSGALNALGGEGAGAGMEGLFDLQGMAGGQLPGLYTNAQADLTNAADFMSLFGGNLLGSTAGIPQEMLGLAGQPGIVDASSQWAIDQGMGLLGQDSRTVVDNTLANLRDAARPYEERAANSTVQSLFNRGILSSTSGARAFGELALTQETADLQRQQMAEQLGQQQFSLNQNAGQSLLGMGQQGLLSGANLNQQLAAMYGNSALQSSGQQFDLINALTQNTANRGLGRLQLAQNAFGFGQQGQTGFLGNISAALAPQFAANQDLRNLINLSITAGGGQASAGAQAGNFLVQGAGDPWGGFLSGLGNSLFDAGISTLGT